MNKNTKGIIILFIVAIIWGFAFVVQSDSVEHLPTFTLNFFRSLVACLGLLLFSILKKKEKAEETNNKPLFISGILSGLSLAIATNIQQFGIAYTTVGKAGFITALYIVFVPIISLLLKKKIKLNIWISIILSVVGFYLLTMAGSADKFSLGLGEVMILICAIFFAIQIVIVDIYVNKVDGLKLSIIQFGVITVISFIPMLFEKPQFSNIIAAIPSVLYLGLISSAVGYTLQIYGQKYVNPNVSSLILSLESVFSVIFGAIVLSQVPTILEIIGCILIFIGIIITQIKIEKGEKKIC